MFIVVVSLNSGTDIYLSYSLLAADSKSKDLTWRKHVEDTSTMANKTLGFVHRNLSECISQVKYVAYNTFTMMRPRLKYSSAVWDLHLLSDVHILEQVHRRAARFVRRIYTQCTQDVRQTWLRPLGGSSSSSV